MLNYGDPTYAPMNDISLGFILSLIKDYDCNCVLTMGLGCGYGLSKFMIM